VCTDFHLSKRSVASLWWVLFGLHIFKASEPFDYRFWRTNGGGRLTEGAKLSRKVTTCCRIDKMKRRELPAIKTQGCLFQHLVNFIFPPFCAYNNNFYNNSAHALCYGDYQLFVTLNYGQWEILKDWIECPYFLFSLHIRLLPVLFSHFYSYSPFLSFHHYCTRSSSYVLFLLLILHFLFSFFIFVLLLSSSFFYEFAFVLVFQFYSCSFFFVFNLLLFRRIWVLLLLFFVLVTVQIGSSSKPSVLNNGGDWYIVPHSY